jgi:uncharacterized membrane protein
MLFPSDNVQPISFCRAMINKRLHTILSMMVAFWCLLIVLPSLRGEIPALMDFSGLVYHFFSMICHQFDNRSFHIAGNKLAVCVRCSSIYFSFFVSLLLLPLFKKTTSPLRSRSILLLVSFPMVLDVVLNIAGVLPSSTVSRVTTGALFGAVLPLYVLPPLQEAWQQLHHRFTFSGGLFHGRETK